METKIPKDLTICILKFIKPKYEKDFLHGKIYMNTLKYFIDLEKESGVRGVGDALEASIVLSDVDITIKDSETDNTLMSGNAGRVNFHSYERIQSPVLCMYSVDGEVLKVTINDDNIINAIPNIEKEELDKLISDFGDNMLIINVKLFVERVIKKCKELNIGYRMGKVNYFDFSINHSDRINKDIDLDSSDICFIKDEFFKSQNEYRVLLDVTTEKPFILDIGDISDIAKKMKITDFFNGRYKIELK